MPPFIMATIKGCEGDHVVIVDHLDYAVVQGCEIAVLELDVLEGRGQLVAFHVEWKRIGQGAVGLKQVDFTKHLTEVVGIFIWVEIKGIIDF